MTEQNINDIENLESLIVQTEDELLSRLESIVVTPEWVAQISFKLLHYIRLNREKNNLTVEFLTDYLNSKNISVDNVPTLKVMN